MRSEVEVLQKGMNRRFLLVTLECLIKVSKDFYFNVILQNSKIDNLISH